MENSGACYGSNISSLKCRYLVDWVMSVTEDSNQHYIPGACKFFIGGRYDQKLLCVRAKLVFMDKNDNIWYVTYSKNFIFSTSNTNYGSSRQVVMAFSSPMFV